MFFKKSDTMPENAKTKGMQKNRAIMPEIVKMQYII